MMMDWLIFTVSVYRTRRIDVFQLLQQFAKRATSHMNQLPVGKNRWNSLYALCIHFALEESAIHHLMTDTRIQQGKDIECLHHIGAVGTSERYVGLQTNIALKGTDATSDSFIGQILSLTVSIEHSQQ